MTGRIYEPGTVVPSEAHRGPMSSGDISAATAYMLSHISDLPSEAATSGLSVLTHAVGRLGEDEGRPTDGPDYTALVREKPTDPGEPTGPVIPEVAIARGIVKNLRAQREQVPRGSTEHTRLTRELHAFTEDNGHLLK